MKQYKIGFKHCNWELKNFNQKPIFVLSLDPFWIGHNMALLIYKIKTRPNNKLDKHF